MSQKTKMISRIYPCFLLAALLLFGPIRFTVGADTPTAKEQVHVSAFPDIRLRLEGEIGRRAEAVTQNWLLKVWDANPGILEMMRLRDRKPDYENPLPWSGEFAGKHLLSAITLRHFSDDPRLDSLIRRFIAELLTLQDTDGYLGPFPRKERLLGHWDLWAHYHLILAFLTWNDETGDPTVLEAARKIGDLICKTYLDSDRKISSAGDYEMNMAIAHGLGALYRKTGEPKYLAMLREVEKEWQIPGAGDYFRQAAERVPFFRQPKPRWESLHDLQALAELYRITGDGAYRDAFLFDWQSILETDVHNSGSFSTLEGAIGTPFRKGEIETCCTVAWVAMSLDAFALSGPAEQRSTRTADALERAAYNAVLGYLHPSGRWATYNTPMNGKREASAHSIVFQSRPGTPELNCCSVNAPRGLGMLAYWAVSPISEKEGSGFFWNYFGPGTITFTDRDGIQWKLTQKTNYPAEGLIEATLEPSAPTQATVYIRVPEWAKKAEVVLNPNGSPAVILKGNAGSYLPIARTWKQGDALRLQLEMKPRALRGDADVDFKSSLYHGPVLLAWDQSRNATDFADFPTLDFKRLQLKPDSEPRTAADRQFPAMLAFEVEGKDAAGQPRTVRLCDFASAGAMGGEYQSWLPVDGTGPGSFTLSSPGSMLPGKLAEIFGVESDSPKKAERPAVKCILSVENPPVFDWSSAGMGAKYRLSLSEGDDPASAKVLFESAELDHNTLAYNKPLDPAKTYFWNVKAITPDGEIPARNGPWVLRVAPDARPRGSRAFADPLAGTVSPRRPDAAGQWGEAPGVLLEASGFSAARDREGKENGAIEFSGNGKIRYATPGGFPQGSFTISVWFRADETGKKLNPTDRPHDRMQQIVSAWCESTDDPIRLTLQRGKVSARIEAGHGFMTPEVPIEPGRWYHAVVVKTPERLRLYLDGKLVAETPVAIARASKAVDLGLGCNPHLNGNENFLGTAADLQFLDYAADP